MNSRQMLQAAFVAAAAAACSQTPSPGAPSGPSGPRSVRVDTVRVQVQGNIDDLEEQVARLQIQVLERDVQLAELQEQLEATRLELVRNMARLQTQATRAEAASGMAEAEIALGTLRRAPGGRALPELARAETLFDQSSTEFSDENYGGALYLATQARAAVRAGQSRLRGAGSGELRSDEVLFAVPVPLQTTGRSNVRSGPGLNFGVLFALDGGIDVVGESYTSQWVRINDEDGREGWIFYTLLTSR